MSILIRPMNGRYTLFLNGEAVMSFRSFDAALAYLA